MRRVVCVLVVVLLAGCTESAGAHRLPTARSSQPSSAPAQRYTPAPNPWGLTAFEPRSATFSTAQLGWVLGAQPCGSAVCLGLRRSLDGGRHWQPAKPPPTGIAGYQSGQLRPDEVSQVFFADARNGWVFDPGLWSSHDGGTHWTRLRVPGPVLDLAADGTRVLALVQDCPTSRCAGGRLWSTPVAADQLSPVPAAPHLGPLPGPPGYAVFQASLTVAGGVTYLLDASQHSRLWTNANGTWTERSLPCLNEAGPPQLLSAYSATGLVLVCPSEPSAGLQVKTAYRTSTGGHTWQKITSPPEAGYALSLATPGATAWFLAQGRGDLLVSRDAGRHWQPTSPFRAETNDGSHYVAFVTPADGFALPYDANQAVVGLTHDGGHTWTLEHLQ